MSSATSLGSQVNTKNHMSLPLSVAVETWVNATPTPACVETPKNGEIVTSAVL